jgi:cytoskeleton protein RodZ
MEQDANGQPAGLGVGTALKAARERAGMSLGEVADRLKLSIRQLEAIEHDDFQQLPGATFVRGFVRNYARFLRLDPEPLMARLEQHFRRQSMTWSTWSSMNNRPILLARRALARVPPPAAAGGKAANGWDCWRWPWWSPWRPGLLAGRTSKAAASSPTCNPC